VPHGLAASAFKLFHVKGKPASGLRRRNLPRVPASPESWGFATKCCRARLLRLTLYDDLLERGGTSFGLTHFGGRALILTAPSSQKPPGSFNKEFPPRFQAGRNRTR